MSVGKVWLVGAGPGDAGLLTLRGREVLLDADSVVFDRLVGDGVLAMIPKTARALDVGKEGGCHPVPQSEIEKLLVQEAQAGRKVVRLKGGDPFVFGRGGEEAEHLRAAGIAVEVVNGITAGVAGPSALGIPVTHREHAHGVLFITGHAQPGASGPDWRQLAATARTCRLTLVIYMGVGSAAHLQHELLCGLPACTPVAIIQHASMPGQRQAISTLDQLAHTLVREGLGSPSIIVVGDVVRGAASLHQPHARPVASTA